MTEQEIRDLFREMRDETVPADALTRVRTRVADRIQRQASWKIGAWLAAAAMLLAALLLILPQSRVLIPADPSRIGRTPAPTPARIARVHAATDGSTRNPDTAPENGGIRPGSPDPD